jgi:2-polyprenyl-3-methyl-5-hydroxy-6-metoxy-1,4-benzoquinol methylase
MKKEIANNLLNLVKRNYQEIATEFDLTRKKFLWPEIKNLTDNIKEGDKVLDVGCGNGRLLEVLKNKNINYLGVDNSSELIKIARNNYPNYKFLVADILDLSQIPVDSFDYVFCLAVLPHIPGKKLRMKALRELKKKVKNSGKIIISAWNLWGQKTNKKYRFLIIKNGCLKILGKNNLDFGDIIFPWKSSNGKTSSKRYYHAFTRAGLKSLVLKTGIHLEKIKKDAFNYWLILN